MPSSVAITSSDLIQSTSNNEFRYVFPAGAVTFQEGDKIALQTLNIFYSWQNISAAANNNTFQFIWPVSGTTYDVILPDGYYSITEINAYLQSIMYANSLYLTDTDGNLVYFLEIVTNASLYAVQLNSYAVPTAAQAGVNGWTAPPGWGGFPGAAATPRFVIPDTNITQIFGINAGTYPLLVQATNYSKTSDFTPQVSTVSSVYMLCNLVNNKMGIPASIIYNFSASEVGYGNLISIAAPYLVYNPIQVGTFGDITISFVDQNFNAIKLLDTNVSVLLAIERKGEER